MIHGKKDKTIRQLTEHQVRDHSVEVNMCREQRGVCLGWVGGGTWVLITLIPNTDSKCDATLACLKRNCQDTTVGTMIQTDPDDHNNICELYKTYK